MPMRSAPTPRHLALALGLALSSAGCSEIGEEDLVWPTSGTTEPQRLSSTFGPRLRGSEFDTYDFHRGIDIPVPPGSPIYAAAAGKVKRAGEDPGYSDRIVQIEHCTDDGCFYTNYAHLTGVVVSIGQEVEQGELVALSGFGETGFPHLHFELRDERSGQDHCVHPLHLLPMPGWLVPWVEFGPIDDADPAQASVEVTVSLAGLFPELLAVEIETRDRASGATLDERTFDLDAWNRDHTPEGMEDLIDNPDLDGIHVAPARFNEETAVYSLTLRFNGLTGVAAPGDLEVTARARDVHGTEGVAISP